MNGKRYKPEQIIHKLREAEVELSKGATVPVVCKKLGLAKQYSRHLGGVNLGFLDGHAQWASSQSFINNIAEGTWSGMDIIQGGPNSVCADGCFPQTYPDVPMLF